MRAPERERAAIVATLRARIEHAVACFREFIAKGPTSQTTALMSPVNAGVPSADDITWLVERCVEQVEAVLNAYKYPRNCRVAIAARLANQWSLIQAFTVNGHYVHREWPSLLDILQIDYLAPGRFDGWPSNVSLDEARTLLEQSKHPDAQIVAQAICKGKFVLTGQQMPQGTHEVETRFLQIRSEEIKPDRTNFFTIVDPGLQRAVSGVFCPPFAALVVWAEKAVCDDQRKARPFALPASRLARVTYEFMGRCKALRADEWGGDVEPISGGVRIYWEGKSRGEQLTLAFAMRDATTTTYKNIVDELGAEGLRDYVILHRMAAAKGRTGMFKWTWAEHRQATRHAARVRSSIMTDPSARAAVEGRIMRLTRAELHMEVEDKANNRRMWQVIGKGPLVSLIGGVEQGGRIEGLILQLNAALYEGAVQGSRKPYFTQLPEAVFGLLGPQFCLAVFLSIKWRYARDEGGAIELSVEDVLRYADTTSHLRSRHQRGATAQVKRTLDAVSAAMGEGCRWEPVEGGKYRITPPRFWVDSLVHGAPPVLPPTTTNAPSTGGELVAWRRKHTLSQAAAALALGVSPRTIKRAEHAAAERLPRAFVKAAWESVTNRRRAIPEPV